MTIFDNPAFNIDPAHITRVRSSSRAIIRDGQVVIRRNRRDPQTDKWIADDLIAKEFDADIWATCHGYEVWTPGADGKRQRDVRLAALDQPKPQAPADATPIYLLPIYSGQWGGRADLQIDDKLGSEALSALFAEMQSWEECASRDPLMLPRLKIARTVQTEYGLRPVFEIIQWDARSSGFGEPLMMPKPSIYSKINEVRRRNAEV
jgi:hypothetical protein